MTTVKTTNPFILPKMLSPGDLEDEYDHKEFKQWISDLPVGNVSKTARSLHHEIKRLNLLDMSPVERFEAIQLMLPALSFVLEKLRAHFSTKPIPLSKENRLIARLHLELLMGVVVAYKTVMSQFHDDSFTGHFLHKRTRSESVRRTLYFLGEILLHEYSIYRASPKFVWREIHGVYHYAVINDLRSNDSDSDADDIFGHLSVTDIYKRILLLALADPSSMLRGEIKRVNEILIDWLPEVSLVPIDHAVSPNSMFIVDATKDAPPYVVNDVDIKTTKIGWLLLVDKLDQLLEKKLGEIRGKSESKLRPVELVTATLYSRLRKKWSPDTVLREERTDGHGAIEVTSGLESLHWLFGGWKLQQEVGEGLESSTDAESGSQEENSHDRTVHAVERDEFVIDADPELIAAIVAESEYTQEQEEAGRAAQSEVEIEFYNAAVDDGPSSEKCACVNQSRRGYYLTWSGEGEYQAHVGEIIGVNSRDHQDFDSSWGLGVIRWMRVQNSGLMGFGVELFEGKIESVKLECHHVADLAAENMLGFLQKRNGKAGTLITKPFLYGEKDKLLLTSVDGQVSVVPGQTIECTDAFMRFKVDFDSSLKKTQGADTRKGSKQEDLFNSIWEDL